MNRYRDGGRTRENVPEQDPPRPSSPLPPAGDRVAGECPSRKTPPDPLRELRRRADGVFSRLDPGEWEAEDLLVAGILYLLYRESGDGELLTAILAYLFL